MSFLGDHEGGNLAQLGVKNDAAIRRRVLDFDEWDGTVLSAACLHFASLDREAQIDSVLPERFGKVSTRGLWRVRAPDEIVAMVRGWNFPLFRQSDVLLAALKLFLALPEPKCREWLREVFLFVGQEPRPLRIA